MGMCVWKGAACKAITIPPGRHGIPHLGLARPRVREHGAERAVDQPRHQDLAVRRLFMGGIG